MKRYESYKWVFDQFDRLDEEAQIMAETEEDLVADVRYYWQRTRLGPHDDCDCYWMYQYGLKRACERLRAFRRGTYQAY